MCLVRVKLYGDNGQCVRRGGSFMVTTVNVLGEGEALW